MRSLGWVFLCDATGADLKETRESVQEGQPVRRPGWECAWRVQGAAGREVRPERWAVGWA